MGWGVEGAQRREIVQNEKLGISIKGIFFKEVSKKHKKFEKNLLVKGSFFRFLEAFKCHYYKN